MAPTTFKDKYGKVHPTEIDAAFANVCYSMMAYMTDNDGFDLLVGDAENIVAKLIDPSRCGINARAMLKAFIGAIEKHHDQTKSHPHNN